MMRHIVVVAYNPSWPAAYEAEARRVRDALGDVLLELHHIGSTSVPNLPAKPVIDILAVVRSTADLDARDPQMRTIDYEPRGEFHIPGRRYFTHGTDENRTHHLHAFPTGHHRIRDHLLFRDYLRAHPDAVRAYADLKQRLAAAHPRDIQAYCDGKEALIHDLIGRAWRWDAAGR